ncbi:hypothetical protein BJX62DRAFT_243976 [Aspergillus germanicus]
MDSFNHQTCLGIPVPVSVKALAKTPPICHPAPADHKTIEILGELGKFFDRPKDEIKQAQNLAAGLSDIVIILERPRLRRYHEFDVGFDEFVENCETLRAVDELIRFATRGARSIHTTTILNAFSYQPDKEATERDQKCHGVLAEILRTKKPKVILRCHTQIYQDKWLKCIEQQCVNYEFERKEINIAEDNTTATTVVLQSFHPSRAVNHAVYRPEYRALLIYHFVAAFSELNSEFRLPQTAEEIQRLCGLKGEDKPGEIPEYKEWEAANRISQILKSGYKGPSHSGYVGFEEDSPDERHSRQLKAFIRMYITLIQLLENSAEPGSLAIERIVLFLRPKRFQKHLLYERIMTRLILRGNEQTDWLRSETLPDSDPRPLVRDSLENKLRSQMVDKLTKHNTLIREYLSEARMSDSNKLMHIRALVSQCEAFVNDDASEEDMNGLLRSLDKLTCVFEDHDV